MLHLFLLWHLFCAVEGAPKDFVKAGFIYLGEISDFGWNFAHDQGRVYLQDVAFKGRIYTEYAENMLGNDTLVKQTAEQWLAEDYDIIFSTSFEQQFPLSEVAAEALARGSETKFVAMTGFLTGPNLITAFAKIEQSRYLTGLLAGRMSKSGEACYIAAFREISEVTRGIDSFTIGFREAYPDAKVYVYILNTWSDPDLEERGAMVCNQEHPEADVYTQHSDGLAIQKFAKSVGAWGVGYNSDMRIFIGETVLSSPLFVWGPLYERIIERIYEDTWIEADSLWPGIDQGVIKIASLSNQVPAEIVIELEDRLQELINDPTKDVFCSPLIGDNSLGEVDANGCLSEEQLLNLHTYIEGAFFSGNVTIPPPEELWLAYSAPISIAFLVVAATGIFFCFCLLVLILLWKSNGHFKASSKDFLVLILIGTMIGLGSVFLLPGDPNPAQCQAFLWVVGTAFIIVYGSIFIKTFRIWKIFHDSNEPKSALTISFIPTWQLFLALGVMLMLDYVILIVWTAVDYPTVVLRESVLYDEDQVVKECHWVHKDAFLGAFLGYKGFLIILGCILSWNARKIHIAVYNESHQLGLMMYNILVVGTVLVAIQQTIAELSLDAVFALSAIMIEWVGISGTIILFIPKIYGHVADKKKETSSTPYGRSGRTSKTPTSRAHTAT